MFAIWGLLRSTDADVIALHEVSVAAERDLRAQRWVKSDFALTELDGFYDACGRRDMAMLPAGEDRTGSVLMVSLRFLHSLNGAPFSVRFGRFGRSTQARGCILFDAQPVDRPRLRILASQFDSNVRHTGSAANVRAEQYADARAILVPPDATMPTVEALLIDANHSQYDETQPFRDAAFVDAYEVVHPHVARDPFRADATFGQLVPFFDRAPRHQTRKPRRVDLALVRGPASVDKAVHFGEAPVRGRNGQMLPYHLGRDGLMFPSDHLGLSVALQL